jgi:hypothetical protein
MTNDQMTQEIEELRRCMKLILDLTADPLSDFRVFTVAAMMSIAVDSLLKASGSAMGSTWREIRLGAEDIGGNFIKMDIDSGEPS